MPLQVEARQHGVQQWAVYAHNPRAFVHDLFRDPAGDPVVLEDYQVHALMTLAAGDDLTWRAGHGCGKTLTMAVAVFWFLLTRPFSKIPTTAPTFRQVKEVLWAEIASWYQRCRVKHHLELTKKPKLAIRGREDEWFAIGVASNRQANIEGFHAPRILFIVDEAKGVPDPIFDAIDGALTTGEAQRAYVSTPGSRVGRFYESHFGKIAKFFTTLHTSGEQSARVNRTWIAQKREEWGEDSAIYIAKVRGEFPQEGDDIVFPLYLLDAAQDAFDATLEDDLTLAVPHRGPKAVGLDIARFGFDHTVAAVGSSCRIDRLVAWKKAELDETVDRAQAIYNEEDAARVATDDGGLGGGVTAYLRRAEVPVLAVNFGSSATDDLHYANIKAEMAANLRAAMLENYRARQGGSGHPGTFALVPHDRLRGQLSNLRWRAAAKGRYRLLDPDDPSIPVNEVPKGLRVSPDHAHAVLLCYHGATNAVADGMGVLQDRESPRDELRARVQARRRFNILGPGR